MLIYLGIGMCLLAILQISLFRVLPAFLRKLFVRFVFLGVLFNFLLSGMVLMFTGIGNLIGLMNLGSSLGMGGYLLYLKHNGRW